MTTKTKQATETGPALYCGTYAKYNNGFIDGQWLYIDNYADEDEFLEACRKLHADESDPELMFQDYEEFPNELYAESMGRTDLAKLYQFVNMDEYDREVVAAYFEGTGESASYFEDLGDIVEKLYCTLTDEQTKYMSSEERMGWYAIDEGLLELPKGFDTNMLDVEYIGRIWLDNMTISGDYVFSN